MYLNLDHHDPDQIALADDAGRRQSYGDLVRYLTAYSPDLAPRSLIFALASNEVGYVAQVLALIQQGHVPLLLSADLEPDLLDKLHQEYRPAAYLVPRSMAGSFDHAPILEDLDYSLLRTREDPASLHDELELLLSTSGSTGSPKLVRFRKGNMEANADNVARVFGWSPAERHIASLPLNYVMGLNAMFSHLTAGATVLLTGANIMAKEFWEFVRIHRATNFTGVPFSYEVLLRLRPERMDLPHLTTFAQGGGKLSEKTFRKMAQLAREQGWRFIPTYGTTETSARCAFLPPELTADKTLSIGQAIPNVKMTLVDGSGHPVTTPHTEGELVIEGSNVSMGYAAVRADLAHGDEFNGRYRTGDLAVFDEDGCFYIKGRTRRFIKMLGNRIGLDECEQILLDECSEKVTCIGREDLLLILTEKADGHAELRTALARKLKLQPSLFKVIQREDLPRSASGKILYHQLEKEYLKA